MTDRLCDNIGMTHVPMEEGGVHVRLDSPQFRDGELP